MRLQVGLLVASIASGLLSVAGALLAMQAASLQLGLVMLLTMFGYVLMDRGARRVRWAIAVGVGLLAVVTALRLLWHQEQVDEAWLPHGDGVAKTALLPHWQEMFGRERLAALGLLAGVLCFTAGALAVPSRGKWRGVVTTILAVLLLVWSWLSSVREFGKYPLLERLEAVWPALLFVLATIGALALSGRRADRRWMLPAGLFLLSLGAAHAYSHLTSAWTNWWIMANPPEGTFWQMGVTVSAPPERFPQVSRAIEAAVALLGAGLAAVGALHGSRDADASKTEAGEG